MTDMNSQNFLFNFVVYKAIATNTAPDGDPTRAALITSLMPIDLFPGILIAQALAPGNSTTTTTTTTTTPGTSVLARRKRLGAAPAAPAAAKVKVPHVGERTEKADIERHFRDHKLRARVFERPTPGINAPMLAHQWPEHDTEVDADDEIQIVMLTPAPVSAGKRG